MRGSRVSSAAEYQIADYQPTFNKGAYQNITAESLIESLGTPSASGDYSNKSS